MALDKGTGRRRSKSIRRSEAELKATNPARVAQREAEKTIARRYGADPFLGRVPIPPGGTRNKGIDRAVGELVPGYSLYRKARGEDVSATEIGLDLGLSIPFLRPIRGAQVVAKAVGVGSDVPVRPLYAPKPRRAKPTKVRTLESGERVQQIPTARSRITRGLIEKPSDAVSRALEAESRAARAVRSAPILRNMAASRRVAKAAGREEAQEAVRSAARMAEHLDALKVGPLAKRSGVEFAHTWWAQLPKTYRNARGLTLIRGKQAEELAEITSGRALMAIRGQQQEVASALGAARDAGDQRKVFGLMERSQDLKVLASDLPQQAEDLAKSLAAFDQVISKPPKLNEKMIDGLNALAENRKKNLIREGLLDPAKAAEREGLISRWVGLEPTGEEIYFGHRLGKVTGAQPSLLPRAVGTGKVKLPQGVSRENKLVLAKTGRTAQTFETAVRDWQAALTFESTGRVRRILGEMGRPFEGRVPKDHLLVNLKGRAVPKQWKVLNELGDDLNDDDVVRAAEEILRGSFARAGKEADDLLDAAKAAGVKWGELRVIHQDLAGRVFDQFTPAARAGRALTAYDRLVDVTAASIIFARLGYIPKNIVQNLILAVPHQGPFLLVNAVRAGQVMRDAKLGPLVRGEVGFSGATRALGKEARTQKAVGKVIEFVGSVADDPARTTAFLHEAAAEGVISKVRPVLNARDRRQLIRLFEDPALRPKLNNIRARTNDAMADFSRMTPAQRRNARRLLIIPGWLMAGSRYPFHFAATHPVRSALLAYVAMGEPGAPERLQLNPPVNEWFEGEGYLRGIGTAWGRLRTGSLDPVSTPWEIGAATVNTLRGKRDPFDFNEQTALDFAQPLGAAGIRFAQGEGVGALKRLVPNVQFVQDIISPQARPRYPDDVTRLGRLKREIGVVPIEVRDADSGGDSRRSKSIRRSSGSRSKSLRRK